AGLQGQSVGGLAVRVHRDTDETTGQLTLQPLAHRHVPGVRPAEAHRHAEALSGADGDIRTEGPGRGDEGEREQVRGYHGEAAGDVRGLDDGRGVPHASGGGRVLDEDPEELLRQRLTAGEVALD